MQKHLQKDTAQIGNSIFLKFLEVSLLNNSCYHQASGAQYVLPSQRASPSLAMCSKAAPTNAEEDSWLQSYYWI